MKKYTITVNPKYIISKLGEEKKEFNSKEELEKFLEDSGYDLKDEEIISIIENGGEYGNLTEIEFTVSIENIEPEEEETEEEPEEETEEVEKNSFNDSTLFLEEYREYLIGLKVRFEDGDIEQIALLTNVEEDNSVIFETEEQSTFNIEAEEFENFINGENIDGIELLLQEEPEEKVEEKVEEPIVEEKVEEVIVPILFNKPEYKYYLLADSIKILSGFEFKEDAEEELTELAKFDKYDLIVISSKKLLENKVDANDNLNWVQDKNDWNIVIAALDRGVTKKMFTKEQGEAYLEYYKQNKMLHIIKSQLIYLLEDKQKSLRKGFVISNVDVIKNDIENLSRIEKELFNILKLENL